MENKQKTSLENFIFVSRETHMKVFCICPDCGSKFPRWIEGGYDMDFDEIEMHRHTTECDQCIEEENECEEEEEESFPC